MRIFILNLFCALCIFTNAQNSTKTKGEIFIPLKGRTEVELLPLFDTLKPNETYQSKLTFSKKYRFSELYLDKGVAVRTDSILTIKPINKKKNGIDTATLRIIGFANNSRILLYHHFIITPEIKFYPNLNKGKGIIVMNNNALERNDKYKSANFTNNAILEYIESEDPDEQYKVEAITVSLVNKDYDKNFFIKGEKLNEEVVHAMHHLHFNSLCYIRLEVIKGKKRKSVWTRFQLVVK